MSVDIEYSPYYTTPPTLPSIRVGGTSQNKSLLNQNESLLNYFHDYIIWYNNQNESLLKIKKSLKNFTMIDYIKGFFTINFEKWYILYQNWWLIPWKHMINKMNLFCQNKFFLKILHHTYIFKMNLDYQNQFKFIFRKIIIISYRKSISFAKRDLFWIIDIHISESRFSYLFFPGSDNF